MANKAISAATRTPENLHFVFEDTFSFYQIAGYLRMPAKSTIKMAVKAAPQAKFAKIPRINTYRSWLYSLMHNPSNRKALLASEKTEIDDLFRTQTAQQFNNDSSKLERALIEVIADGQHRISSLTSATDHFELEHGGLGSMET